MWIDVDVALLQNVPQKQRHGSKECWIR